MALWVAVFTAVASAVDYYRRFNHVLTGARAVLAASTRSAETSPPFAGSSWVHQRWMATRSPTYTASIDLSIRTTDVSGRTT